MIVYEASKSEFLTDVFMDQLVKKISEKYADKIGRTNEREVRSWEHSMQYMYRVLSDVDIPPNAGVAIEFKVPYTSKRIDFLISGRNQQHNAVVIVELKQWAKVEKVGGKEAIVKTVINRGLVETTHPSYQAWSYASLIADYNENVQEENIELAPCTYLHNYELSPNGDPLVDPIYASYLELAPVFTKGDAQKLRDFIKSYIKYGDDKANLYKIDRGRIRPSKSLQDSLSLMLKGNQEFLMIDEQKVVYEMALTLARKSQKSLKKEVLLVEGGPGTGKSVLAIHLLVQLTQQGLLAQYVTRNAAPRNIYATKLKGEHRRNRIDNLFKGSGSYVEASMNEFDCLIIDEAHRLNEKSGMFHNLGENQMKEIIFASQFSIFFIDERQRVTWNDVGNVAAIEQWANQLGANVTRTKLSSQFRCDGSDGYVAWLDDLLQIRETANVNDIGMDYDFRIFTNPHELMAAIVEKNKIKNKARIVAGYCWNWQQETRNNPQHRDIYISEHDFGLSWNLANTETWAIDENSVAQAGCIHTCQGLEFEFVGVIIGDDLIYRDGSVVTDYSKRAKTDQSLKGINKMKKDNPAKANQIADEIIRNTYRTLMTRGQKGCYVYCTDKQLENYIIERFRHAALND
jgi:DUF2075 family protein